MLFKGYLVFRRSYTVTRLVRRSRISFNYVSCSATPGMNVTRLVPTTTIRRKHKDLVH